MQFIMPSCNRAACAAKSGGGTKQNKMTLSSFLAYILFLKKKRCWYCSTNAYKKKITTTTLMIAENLMLLHTKNHLLEWKPMGCSCGPYNFLLCRITTCTIPITQKWSLAMHTINVIWALCNSRSITTGSRLATLNILINQGWFGWAKYCFKYININ